MLTRNWDLTSSLECDIIYEHDNFSGVDHRKYNNTGVSLPTGIYDYRLFNW